MVTRIFLPHLLTYPKRQAYQPFQHSQFKWLHSHKLSSTRIYYYYGDCVDRFNCSNRHHLKKYSQFERTMSSSMQGESHDPGGEPNIEQCVKDFINSNKVALFSKSWCPFCKKAKGLLDRQDVEYKTWELDLDANGEMIQSELFEITKQKTVPNIFIGQKHIGGFSDLNALHQAGTLTQLLGKTFGQASNAEYANVIEEYACANNIMVFSRSDSSDSSQTIELLKTYGKEFTVLQLDREGLKYNGEELASTLLQITGQPTFPYIHINGTYFGNYNDLLSYHQNGLLEDLLSKSNYEYDLVVIGGGSGGITAAKEASMLGKKVCVCDFVSESPRGTVWGLGGTCVNVGCIPKKLMHRASIIHEDLLDGKDFGWNIPTKDLTHNWNAMVTNIQRHITSLNDQFEVTLKENNVDYYNAYASFIDKNTVKITDKEGASKTISGNHFIIAVGGRPTPLNIPNAEGLYITSDDLFSLKHPPGNTLVIGASYIALECAGFIRGLGYNVTVMVRSILLRGFDQECAKIIETYMGEHGVSFIKPCIPVALEKNEKDKILVKGKYDNGDNFEGVFDTVLVAIGRTAATATLNLKEIGVRTNSSNQKIIVNSREQTTVKNIYAIGDVIEQPELTPVAIQAGKLLTKRLYHGEPELMDYQNIPTTVFTPLEYGTVGLSEEAALSKFGENMIEIFHSNFTPIEQTLRTWGSKEFSKGYAKMICLKNKENSTEPEDMRLIGLHLLSPNAGEIVQGFALGVRMKVTKKEFDALVGIHPTVAEVFTTMRVTKASGKANDESC